MFTDIKLLKKEIKSLHSELEKALKKSTYERMAACFLSVFGSNTNLLETVDSIYNLCSHLNWTCRIPDTGPNTLANVHVVVQLDRNLKYQQVDIIDKKVYDAKLPLDQVAVNHDSWKKQLGHVIRLLQDKHQPVYGFNLWPEAMVIERMGLTTPFEHVSDDLLNEQAIITKCAIEAVQKDPGATALAWPTLVPWLHAMQCLSPPPLEGNGVVSMDPWQAWSCRIKECYTTKETMRLTLPDEFKEECSIEPNS